eukprot:m.6981 g.6981  ORF g.6981 m.6981 type:complete len:51 (+) comp5340_c0_seq2:33-185(+)
MFQSELPDWAFYDTLNGIACVALVRLNRQNALSRIFDVCSNDLNVHDPRA